MGRGPERQLLEDGKFFEPGSLLCHFMIWVLALMIHVFRILYRVNVVKFVKLVISYRNSFDKWITILLSERRTYLTREYVEGQAPRITRSRAKSILLSLRNIVIIKTNHHECTYLYHIQTMGELIKIFQRIAIKKSVII